MSSIEKGNGCFVSRWGRLMSFGLFVMVDVDECENALQCPGQECVNSQGSFACVACKAGFQLSDGQCSGEEERCFTGSFHTALMDTC